MKRPLATRGAAGRPQPRATGASRLLFGAASLALLLAAPRASAGYGAGLSSASATEPAALPLLSPLSPTAWFTRGLERAERFRLPGSSGLSLLERFANPSVERTPDWRRYFRGRYGVASWGSAPSLAWSGSSCEPAAEETPVYSPELELRLTRSPGPAPLFAIDFASGGLAFPSPEPEALAVTREPVCPPWRRPRELTIGRYGGEADVFRLLDCDGAVADEALDRLSILARPPGVERPAFPLPLDPDPARSALGEWVSGVKMLHPRLVWIVERIAEAFPRRAIYIISGYRPDGSKSTHTRGRALDLFVAGIDNERLFRFCHEKLHDVGCGYYPNNKFVHVDVRPFGTGHPMWIDVSAPGTPSKYVDSWPGVVDGGALVWGGEE
ncbi:MAG: DUF882 domain-containing protein [Sorangiineae bacterium]|nr:DUF882 domain-containing protein [Polyangiaceae bacterium]MEB2323411.1 DUF882 domain-containing protein [Sorangiineae bacterium]